MQPATAALREQPPQTNSASHPSGLYVLFTTEMWERFSFYGMRALMKLYMVKALLFDETLSSQVYGSYLGLVYLTPLLGGYVADRYWGNRRSILVGGLLMAMGQFVLFASASAYYNASFSHLAFYAGLALLIFGNGFFKPNISSMVGTLYPARDTRIDAAYTIFYMGINLGAFFSPLVCGFLGDTDYPADFRYGFLAAGIGMLIGTATFEWLKSRYVVTATGAPLGAKPVPTVVARPVGTTSTSTSTDTRKNLLLLGLFAGVFAAWYFLLLDKDWIGSLIFSAIIVVPISVLTDSSLTAAERRKINVVLILGFFVIFFWAAFEQAGNSLTTFADRQTERHLGSYQVPASYFQSINALFVIAFAPVFAVLWTWLGRRRAEPSSPLKMAYGLAFLALGYLVIAFGVKGASATTKVSMFWLFALYLIHTFGELCLSPIGLALVNKLAPARFASLMMAVWFLAIAAGNAFSGTLGALYPERMVPVDKVEALNSQVKEFNATHQPTAKKTKERSSVHKLLDSVFGSPGQALAAKEFSLFPTGWNPAKNDAQLNGVKVISTDKVRLEDIDDPALREQVTTQLYDSLVPNPKKFAGFTVSTFYDFFMVFVALCGAASFILLLIYRRLTRLMADEPDTAAVPGV